jgi:Zn-dependent peptidase ImmA (M78 family)
MPTYDTNFGAKRAREARERFGLGDSSSVPCVLTLAETHAQLPVIVGRLPDHIAGALWRNGVGAIVWVNAAQSLERQRFTVAHELGHVGCRHADTAVDTAATISGRTHDPREVQANAFAAELLAPAAGVRAMLHAEPTLEDVVRIAARYGISPIAALFRLGTLGLTRRIDALRGEIDDGLVADVRQRIDVPPFADEIAAIGLDDLPRLSPAIAGGALAAIAAGRTSIEDAASAADCPPERLASGAATIGI